MGEIAVDLGEGVYVKNTKGDLSPKGFEDYTTSYQQRFSVGAMERYCLEIRMGALNDVNAPDGEPLDEFFDELPEGGQ